MFVLSIIAIFAGMLFTGGTGPTFPFNPSPPVFNSPLQTQQTATNHFTVTSSNYSNLPLPNHPKPNATLGTFHGCSISEYWNCVNDPNGPDINTSLWKNFRTDISLNTLFVNVTVPTPLKYITSLTMDIRCYTPFNETPFFLRAQIYTFYGSLAVNEIGSFKCSNPTDSIFPQTLVPMELSTNDISTINGFLNGQMFLGIDLASIINVPFDRIVYISTINFQATYSNQNPNTVSCSSGDIFCQLGQLGSFFSTALQYFALIGAGVIWLFSWIGVIIQLVVNYVSIIIWLYNIPGMPFVIQLYISAVLTTWLGIIGFEIFKIIKPFGGS